MNAQNSPAGATLIKRAKTIIDWATRRVRGNFQRASGQYAGWGRYWPLAGIACLAITASLTALLLRYFLFSFVKRWACAAFSAEPTLFWPLLGGFVILGIQPAWRFLRRVWRAFRAGLLNRSAWVIVGLVCGVCQGFTNTAWAAVAWLAGAVFLTPIVLLIVPRAGNALSSLASHAESDVPITTEEEDYLGRGPFVEVLAGEVLSGPNSVVALVGELGAGKSSVLHLLKHKLEKSPESPVIVDFKAWLPSGEGALVSDLLRSIETEVRQQFWWPALSGAVREFMRTISLKGFGAEVRIGSWFEDKSQRQRLMALNEVAKAFPRRVVVLVDEIDRMDRPELHELFKILRGVPELENICFACALDLDTVAHTLSSGSTDDNALAAARRYIEKFFATRFYLPLPADERLFDHVYNKLSGICSDSRLEHGKEGLLKALHYLEPGWDTYRAVFRTPRRVKIILNSMIGTRSGAPDKLNPTDLLNLMAVWTLNPGLVAEVCEKPEYFAQVEWGSLADAPIIGGAWGARNGADAQRKQYLERKLEALRTTDGGPVVLRLLAAMFPHVREVAFGNAHISRRDYEQAFRIAHPRFFLRYFTHVIPGSQFPEADLEKLMSRLQDESEEQASSEIVSILNTLEPDSLVSRDFLSSMGSRLDGLPERALFGIAKALAQTASRFEDATGGLGSRAQVKDLVFRVASSVNDGQAMMRILQSVIEATPDEAFAALILYFCIHKEHNRIVLDWKGIDSDVLRSAFAVRLQTTYRPDGEDSLFNNGRGKEYCLPVLFVWAECGPSALNHEVAYLDSEFKKDPRNLGRLAGWVATRGAGAKFLKFMRDIYPEVHQLIKLHEQMDPGMSYSTPDELEALEQLRELLADDNEGAAAAAE